MQEHWLSCLCGFSDRIGCEIDFYRSSERISNYEERRREVVGSQVGVDATLEISVSRKHTGGYKVLLQGYRYNSIK